MNNGNTLDGYFINIGAKLNLDSIKSAMALAKEKVMSFDLGENASGFDEKISGLLQQTGLLGQGGNLGDLNNMLKGQMIPLTDALIRVNKKVWEVTQEYVDQSKEIGNQMVSGQSAFIDEDIRSTMTNYGVSSEQAQAMQRANEIMGISNEDLSQLLPEQAKLYQELLNEFTSSVDSLDTYKLAQYQKAVQTHQIAMAKLDMQKEIAYYEMMINAQPQLEKLYETTEEITEGVIDTLTWLSESGVFNAFLDFLNGMLKPLSWLSEAGSFLFGGKEETSSKEVAKTEIKQEIQINGVANDIIAKQIEDTMANVNRTTTSNLGGVYD